MTDAVRLQLVACVTLIVLVRAEVFRGLFDAVGRGLDRLARRPLLARISLFLLTTALGATVSWMTGLPGPAVHDEFSYLLAADTFHSGRLANPTHPMWRHFETFHVLAEPSYASKYPPAMGLLLAGGTVLGHPLVGVWIGMGLAVVGVYWMLLGWVPRRWAFVGGLLLALHPYVQLNWGQGYWGGELPLLGGALVLGAVPRLWRRAAVGSSVLLAVGAGLLANARPFEGFVLCLPVAGLLAWRLVTSGPRFGAYVMRFVLPATVVLGGIGAGMLRYNAAVTGHPLKMPYTLHHARYEVCPVFLWQPLQPEPEYHNAETRRFYTGWALDWYERQRTLAGVADVKGSLIRHTWWSLVGGLLTIPVAVGLLAVRGWRRTFGVAVVVVSCGANLCVPWLMPHYLAPVLPIAIVAAVWGSRSIGRGVDSPMRFAAAFVLLTAGVFAYEVRAHVVRERSGHGRASFTRGRERVLAELHETPGRDLVLVHYWRTKARHREWVYNDADVDGSEIVWARELSSAEDAELRTYFADRIVWRLHADERSVRLERLTQ